MEIKQFAHRVGALNVPMGGAALWQLLDEAAAGTTHASSGCVRPNR